MAASIAEDMKELNSIVAELKELNTKVKTLRIRRKQLETSMIEYLDSSGLPGVKYRELVVLKKESTTHARLNRKSKEENMIKTLQNLGINEPEKALDLIKKSTIGEQKVTTKLKIQHTIPEIQ